MSQINTRNVNKYNHNNNNDDNDNNNIIGLTNDQLRTVTHQTKLDFIWIVFIYVYILLHFILYFYYVTNFIYTQQSNERKL